MIRRFAWIALSVLATGAALAQNWTQKVIVPQSRGFYAAAFDAGLGQFVLFGGVKAASGLPLADTWVWDGTNWTRKTPLNSPPARWGAAMVYDPVYAQIVLFGGFGSAASASNTANSALNDTWVWDGGNWTQMSPATSPPARYLHTLGYDSHNGNAVLFGGTASTNATIFHGNTVAMNDTWLWDGANWSLVTPAQSPSARSQSAAAYDTVHQRLILFGGAPGASANNTLADTWAWDGTNWTHLSSASPSPRSGHAMSFDPVAQKIVMYGGDPESAVNHVMLGGAASALELNDTWTWDGTTWTTQTPAVSPYRGRSAMVAAYDAVRQQTVFFGGIGNGLNAFNSDTWIWNGSTWSSPPQTVHATARFGAAAVYDAGHQQVLVFGGTTAGQQDDTWIWDGTSWTRHTAGGPTSQQCRGVYDAARQQVLLFLDNGATWTWNGSSWTQQNPTTVPDPEDFALSYDALHQQVVLFGLSGTTQTMSTWLWNGSNWTLQSPAASPSNRFAMSMAYDAGHQQTVLFGGISADQQTIYSDTWLWDGSNWTQASPANHPAARSYAAMAYDSGASHILVFGGSTGSELSHSVVGDTWAWSGSNWTVLLPSSNPSARDVHAMAYDAARQNTLIFGGLDANLDTQDDTWVFSNLVETPVTITVPAGVSWSLDGFPFTGTQTVNLPLGAHTLGTTSPQGEGTGTQAAFVSWSDGGAQSHLISVGATAINITGTFHTQYLLTTAGVPANEGSAIPLFPPASAPYYDSGSVVTIQASPNAGFDFEHWGGACSGSTSLCLVVMTGPMSVNASFVPSLLWVPLFPASSPPALVGGAMAYDSIRQETVLFGGNQNNVTGYAGTWIWDGTNWTQRFPAASPPARSYHGMAYDAARQQVVLFGGFSNSGGYVTDTWVWDGVNWTQKNPAASPSGRLFCAMTYDAAHQQVVLFGGAGTNGILGDTWTWDGSNWTQRNPAVSPAGRSGPTLAFDGGRQQVVLFGGVSSTSTYYSDTWLWNGSTWTAKSPAIVPPGRGSSIGGYDALIQQVVLFSGDTTDNDNGTWLWDGTNWQQKSYPVLPSRRDGAMGAYDAARQQLVLYGGIDLTGSNGATLFNDDTWVYTNSVAIPPQYPLTLIATPPGEGTVTGRVSGQTGPNYFAGSKVQVTASPAAGYGLVSFSGDCSGTTCTVIMTGPKTVTATFAAPIWVPLFPAASPSSREGAGSAFDSVRQQTVLFGGVVGQSTPLADTWTWNGITWTQMFPATVPPPRYFHAMAYDSLHQQTVLFGGTNSTAGLADTWVWDGNTWTQKHPVHSPAPRWGSAIAYDPIRQQVILFGGTSFGSTYADTWLWDGNDWTGMNLPGPPAIYFASMTFDAARRQTVLFGGFSGGATVAWLNQTWLWNGSAWTQANPAVSPPGRSQAVMAYDPVMQQTVLFGGSVQGSIAADTWVWDGVNWIHLSYADFPYYRDNSTMAYDDGRRELVLFGGGGLGAQNDTWVFTLTRSVPPQYPLTVAAAPPQDGTAQATDTVGEAGPNYYAGSPVQVVPSPGAGFEVASFSGDCTGITCNLTMSGPKSVTANFGPALNWVELFPAAQPQAESLLGFIEPVPLAYDAARQQTVLFGGPYGGQPFGNQTWVWDGTNWKQKFPAHVPPGRAGHGMAYDPMHQQVVMFGGSSATVPGSGAVLSYAVTLSDTWVWDGTDWTQKSIGAGPPARLNHALSWDGQHVVLFGGWVGNFTAASILLSDTWTWDGNAWTQHAVGGPGGRSDFAMAYDSTHGKVVLFSGFDAGANDTWLWDGAAWTQTFPLTSPPTGDFAMADDTVRQEMVLFAQSLTTPQTWAWDGNNWLQRTPANVPLPRDAAGMVFDTARSQMVLFGGTYLDVFSDTWIYAPNVQQSTAITIQTVPSGLPFSVDGGAAQAAPQTVMLTAGPHTIAVAATEAGPAGTQYVFTSWSDGGGASDTITVGTTAATYSAAFKTQYQLTISASPAAGGAVTPASGGFYDAGTAVPISATANAGYQFSSWTGSVTSASSAATTVAMSAPETVVANFSSLTGITIQTSPPGLQFSVDGSAAQNAPQTLVLPPGAHTIAAATPQAGGAGTQYVFLSWSDGGAASHSITVGSSAATYTATFQTQYQLTTAAAPSNGGTITPSSGAYYNAGSIVNLTAAASSGFQFSSWAGSVASSTSASTTVTMSAAETVTASFSPLAGVTLQTSPPGLQFTVDGGAPQTAPATMSLSQGPHTIAVAATQAGSAGMQFAFLAWSDGGAASHGITVGGTATYTATFQTQYQLITAASPSNGGTVSPSSGTFYPAGTAVSLAVSAASGFQFSSWTGSVASSTNASTTVTMSAPETVTANFTAVIVSAGLGFFPVTPCRVVDTRAGQGFAGQFGPPSMAANQTRSFTIPSSGCNIPATAQAYSLNVTVVPAATLGYLTLWPAGQAQPSVSTLNSLNGAILANAAIVPAGPGGAVSVFAANTTDLIIDINGYFAPPSRTALAFYPVTPCRVADTRGVNGAFGGPPLTAGGTRSFNVPASACRIPATAQAYSLNLTAVPPGPLTYLTAWPTGQTQPNVSTLNALQGQIAANAAIVPAGTNGAVSVFVSDPSNAIIDINGYFAPPGSAGSLYFYPLTPCRIADTRNTTGTFGGPSLGAGATRTFPIPTSSCGVPATAQAYSLNMTAVPSGALLYLSTWPAGQSQPVVSTLNDLQGQVVANAALVPAGTSGAISVFVSDATNLVIDINGYFGQ